MPPMNAKPGLKALLIGATGLVGHSLLLQLFASDAYSDVTVFTRSPLKEQHEKLKVHVVNFDKVHEWQDLLEGDVLFCCLGTTRRAAGSKEEQWKVDYDYQYKVAMAAHFNGVNHLLLVSSLGADPDSVFFYSRMKGALEQGVTRLNFPMLTILQPSALTGHRNHPRAGEQLAIRIMNFVNKLGLFRKYRPIPADVVAAALLQLSLRQGEPAQEIVSGPSIFGAAETPVTIPTA